jgi:hypothetical protein
LQQQCCRFSDFKSPPTATDLLPNTHTGLPDGILTTQKTQFGEILDGFAIEDVGKCILWPFGLFCGHLVYSVAIRYILWLFGTFSPFWSVVPRKIWQPFTRSQKKIFF